MRINELLESQSTKLHNALRLALPLMQKELSLNSLPTIKIQDHIKAQGQSSFGMFIPSQNIIFLSIKNRHPNDVLRTLAHELTHYKQNLTSKLTSHSGTTGSHEENEANALAGKIMRQINLEYPELLE